MSGLSTSLHYNLLISSVSSEVHKLNTQQHTVTERVNRVKKHTCMLAVFVKYVMFVLLTIRNLFIVGKGERFISFLERKSGVDFSKKIGEQK